MAASEIDGIPVITEAFAKTIRLVSTARLREPVLKPLVDNEEEEAILAEIEGATSTRLVAQQRGTEGVSARELVYDVPHAHFINACFAYAKPRESNRFNGPDRGAWYAALSVETSLAEVIFHMTEAQERTGIYDFVVEYAEMFASLAGQYLDLRTVRGNPCLSPDKSIGYPAGNALAAKVRVAGVNGIIYPSIRHQGGTCLVALFPHAVQSVIQGSMYRISWNGNPTPDITPVS